MDDDDALMRGLADLLVRNADGELHRRVPEDIGTPDRPTRKSGSPLESLSPAEPPASGLADTEAPGSPASEVPAAPASEVPGREDGELVAPHPGLVTDGNSR